MFRFDAFAREPDIKRVESQQQWHGQWKWQITKGKTAATSNSWRSSRISARVARQ